MVRLCLNRLMRRLSSQTRAETSTVWTLRLITGMALAGAWAGGEPAQAFQVPAVQGGCDWGDWELVDDLGSRFLVRSAELGPNGGTVLAGHRSNQYDLLEEPEAPILRIDGVDVELPPAPEGTPPGTAELYPKVLRDEAGDVHVVWGLIELPDDVSRRMLTVRMGRSTGQLLYARWDGVEWSEPELVYSGSPHWGAPWEQVVFELSEDGVPLLAFTDGDRAPLAMAVLVMVRREGVWQVQRRDDRGGPYLSGAFDAGGQLKLAQVLPMGRFRSADQTSLLNINDGANSLFFSRFDLGSGVWSEERLGLDSDAQGVHQPLLLRLADGELLALFLREPKSDGATSFPDAIWFMSRGSEEGDWSVASEVAAFPSEMIFGFTAMGLAESGALVHLTKMAAEGDEWVPVGYRMEYRAGRWTRPVPDTGLPSGVTRVFHVAPGSGSQVLALAYAEVREEEEGTQGRIVLLRRQYRCP